MKTLIAVAVLVSASLSFGAEAAENPFVKKMTSSCKVVGLKAGDEARKMGAKTGQVADIVGGAQVLCEQSFQQASADYPIKKARAEAQRKFGDLGERVVMTAYRNYAEFEKNNG